MFGESGQEGGIKGNPIGRFSNRIFSRFRTPTNAEGTSAEAKSVSTIPLEVDQDKTRELRSLEVKGVPIRLVNETEVVGKLPSEKIVDTIKQAQSKPIMKFPDESNNTVSHYDQTGSPVELRHTGIHLVQEFGRDNSEGARYLNSDNPRTELVRREVVGISGREDGMYEVYLLGGRRKTEPVYSGDPRLQGKGSLTDWQKANLVFSTTIVDKNRGQYSGQPHYLLGVQERKPTVDQRIPDWMYLSTEFVKAENLGKFFEQVVVPVSSVPSTGSGI